MANWVILTGDNIRLLDTEKVIFEGIIPITDLDTCVNNACYTCRSYVQAGGNTMEPGPSVPPEVVDDAIAIGRATYLAQEPTGTLLTEIRREERELAYAHLRDIANGLAAVAPADLPPGDIGSGQWGSAPRIAMRSEDTVAELPP
jgi:hypothetical protein